MFYRTSLKDFIRVPPRLFGLDIESAVLKSIKEKFAGYIDKDLGIVIDVVKINDIKEGTIIPGDGAAFYETIFETLTFRPEMQEVVVGKIRDIADFGAFISMGPIEGMIHISQTMDDFVSFSKEKVLSGKESNRILKVGDICRARLIAVSFKDITNPKIGLTMRQQGLGKIEWIEDEKAQKEAKTKKTTEKKETKRKVTKKK